MINGINTAFATGGGTSLNIPTPGDLRKDDILIAHYFTESTEGAGYSGTFPGGWTAVGPSVQQNGAAGSDANSKVAWMRYDPAVALGAVTITGSFWGELMVRNYRGARLTGSPFGFTSEYSTPTVEGSGSSSHPIPSILLHDEDQIVVMCGGFSPAMGTVGMPGGFTPIFAQNQSFWGERRESDAAHTGIQTVTTSASQWGMLHMFNLIGEPVEVVSSQLTIHDENPKVEEPTITFDWTPKSTAFAKLHGGNSYPWGLNLPASGSPDQPDQLYTATNQLLTFTATIAAGSLPPGVSIIEYKWHWGDGSFGYGNPTQHTYKASTEQTRVRLELTDNLGRVYVRAKQLNLTPSALISVGQGIIGAP